MDVYIFLQLSGNYFRVRTKGENNSIKRNPGRSDILTLLILLNPDAKPAVF